VGKKDQVSREDRDDDVIGEGMAVVAPRDAIRR